VRENHKFLPGKVFPRFVLIDDGQEKDITVVKFSIMNFQTKSIVFIAIAF